MKTGSYSEILGMICALLEAPGKKACVVAEGIDPMEFISAVIVRCAFGPSEAWRLRCDLVSKAQRREMEATIKDSISVYSARIRVVEGPFELKDGEELFVVERWMQQSIDLLADLYDRHGGNVQEAVKAFNEKYGRMAFDKCRRDMGPYRRTGALERIIADPGQLAFLGADSSQVETMMGFTGFLYEYLIEDLSRMVEFLKNARSVADKAFCSFKTFFLARVLYSVQSRFVFFPYGKRGGELRYVKRDDELFEVAEHDYRNELFHMVRNLKPETDINLLVKNLKALRRLIPEEERLAVDENGFDALWYLFAAHMGVDERKVYAEILCTYIGLDRNRETDWGVTWEAINEAIARYEA